MNKEQCKVYNTLNTPSAIEKEQIINFLHEHLQEYGDSKKDIRKSLEFALKEFTSFGGFVCVLEEQNEIVGSAIVNQTGMSGYIPENILVYIATHKDKRGKGFGKQIMECILNHASGDIALHVEKNNPAIGLYEKFGFTNPYLEMRLKRK